MTRYDKGDLIGAGGFGQVFEATIPGDNSPYALKQLNPGSDESRQKRFRREVRMQAQLRHQNIVPIVAASLEMDEPRFLMPRARCSLRDYPAFGTWDEDAQHIFFGVCAGMEHAHNNGVIHRDLKPENILLFEDTHGRLYAAVSDFGLGRFVSRDTTTITQDNISMGSLGYMAPEQHRDAAHCDVRADIYSLGKILYEMLTGEYPFPDMDFNQLPSGYRYIVQKTVETSCDDRYQSVLELVEVLRSVAEGDLTCSSPSTDIEEAIREVDGDPTSDEPLRRLANLFLDNVENNEILTNVLPNLPNHVLKALLETQERLMDDVLRAYDQAVSGSLPFSYCDVVADFYKKIFAWTNSESTKIMILKRLPLMAAEHNRWYVGEAFASLVDGLEDVSLILAVRDVMLSSRYVADWCSRYLVDLSLPATIRETLNPPPDTDDIPF